MPLDGTSGRGKSITRIIIRIRFNILPEQEGALSVAHCPAVLLKFKKTWNILVIQYLA